MSRINNTHFLENSFWKFEITCEEDSSYIYTIYDKVNDKKFSDQDYLYSVTLMLNGKAVEKQPEHRKIGVYEDNQLVVYGKFEDCALEFEHIIMLDNNSKWIEEYVTLHNIGDSCLHIENVDFGFRKMLYYQYEGWSDHLDEFTLTSIPTRRFRSQRVDRKLTSFTANDLVYGEWLKSEGIVRPEFQSEGWLWGDDEGGVLVCKYNQTEMEFSRFSRLPIQLPGRGAEDVSIIFGGAALISGDPEFASKLEPGRHYAFGVSKYAAYRGDYKEGYYLYRSHLDNLGHKYPRDYNPPVHWNELYNLGWFAEKGGFFSDNKEIEVYTLDELYKEAETAAEIGAESLYLDPGWDTSPGSTIWNSQLFGDFGEFSKNIHYKYGLKLALHLMMNFMSENEPDYFYSFDDMGQRKIDKEELGLFKFCANDEWVREKSNRLLELAKCGVDFFMFDFTAYASDGVGCCNPQHGHEVPLRKQTHSRNIFKVIQNVKANYPNMLIEAHDRINGGLTDYHQMYLQHGLPNSFDENWGYEYMWNSLQDLISLKALSLYEYNLAYSIPLYLHINEHSDNNNMLQFWWYASVARHLGIGGIKKDDPKFSLLKSAMNLYKKLKPYFTRGVFFGIDYMTHLHVNEDDRSGVMTCYNLTSKSLRKKIILDDTKYKLIYKEIRVWNGIGESIPLNIVQSEEGLHEISFELKMMAPAVIKFE